MENSWFFGLKTISKSKLESGSVFGSSFGDGTGELSFSKLFLINFRNIEDFVDEFLVNVASGSDEVEELFDFIMFSTFSQANNDFRVGETFGPWSGVDFFSKVELLEPPEDVYINGKVCKSFDIL